MRGTTSYSDILRMIFYIVSQPDHHQSLAAGTMEAWDHDQRMSQARHEERHGSQQGQEAGDGHGSDPRVVLTTYLTFLEHKIGHLRGILCSTPPHPQQQHAIVSAELRCIIVQLVSIADDLATGEADASPSPAPPRRCAGEEAVGSPTLSNATHEQPGSDDSDHNAEAADEERPAAGPPYEVVQIEKEEILAPHAHACTVCGKGFKRDANLRMHMRGHGDQYKTPVSLAKPGGHTTPAPDASRRLYYSCPYAGCKRNREHRDFQPLKTPVCVKNHYRRSHCDKSHVCRRCGVKRFSVLADLRTHEKHCGLDRWVCSCGTSFSRKDKLFAHVDLFDGHTPALPPADNDDATVHWSTANATVAGSVALVPSFGELPPARGEAVKVMDQCFSGNKIDDFRCSGGKASMDDGRGRISSPVGIDFCNFDGFNLLGAVAMDFDF